MPAPVGRGLVYYAMVPDGVHVPGLSYSAGELTASVGDSHLGGPGKTQAHQEEAAFYFFSLKINVFIHLLID